jgi:hypothetical protein
MYRKHNRNDSKDIGIPLKAANYRSISTGLASTLLSRRQSPLNKFNRTAKNAKCIKISQILPAFKSRRQSKIRKLRFERSEQEYHIKKTSHNDLFLESESITDKPSIKVCVTPTSSKFKKEMGLYDQIDDHIGRANSDIKCNNLF